MMLKTMLFKIKKHLHVYVQQKQNTLKNKYLKIVLKLLIQNRIDH